MCQSLGNQKFEIGEFTLAANLAGCVELLFKEVKSEVHFTNKGEFPLTYYRTWLVSASRSGVLRTSGAQFYEGKFAFMPGLKNTLEFTGFIQDIASIDVALVPVMALFARSSISFSSGECEITVGFEVTVNLRFEADRRQCLWPFLLRRGDYNFKMFSRTPDFVVMNRKLLSKEGKDNVTSETFQLPEGCMLNAKNTREEFGAVVSGSGRKMSFAMNFGLEYLPPAHGTTLLLSQWAVVQVERGQEVLARLLFYSGGVGYEYHNRNFVVWRACQVEKSSSRPDSVKLLVNLDNKVLTGVAKVEEPISLVLQGESIKEKTVRLSYDVVDVNFEEAFKVFRFSPGQT
jgi:hypothetical protein